MWKGYKGFQSNNVKSTSYSTKKRIKTFWWCMGKHLMLRFIDLHASRSLAFQGDSSDLLSFWNPNRLAAELTHAPNWGFESLLSICLVSLPVSQRWCWLWSVRLLLQLALIVLRASRKAAANTDHNAVHVHTREMWSRQMWGFEPRDAIQLKKRDEDYYGPI